MRLPCSITADERPWLYASVFALAACSSTLDADSLTRGVFIAAVSDGPHPDHGQAAALEIDTTLGPVLGKRVGVTREFLGIPYGQAERFAPPMAAEPWDAPRDATAFGPVCPQAHNPLASTGEQSEDCLSVNVYAPSAVMPRMPVIVFIHGGAFVLGGSDQYDGKVLSESGVIVVTFNYRLGALGFLSLPELDAQRQDAPSGSDGLRDQQLALHWVQDNIAAFGGDQDNVTVVGESAGAISACIHLLSPSSRGLAARYVLESGTCTVDGLGPVYKASADALAQQLTAANCAGQGDVLACLRELPAADLVAWGLDLGVYGPSWLPTIEGRGGVLPDTPDRLFGLVDSLPPFIIGTNKNEWAFFEQTGYSSPQTAAEYRTLIAQEFGAMSDRVLARYPVTSDEQANDVYVRLVSDASFRCPTLVVANLASQRGTSVWMYSFEQGEAMHAQELDYVFGGDVFRFGGPAPDPTLQSDVRRYWTRFASTGDPNGEGGTTWPQYHLHDPQYLQLVVEPSAQPDLASDICDFWRDHFLEGGTVYLF
jgi:para-nitrobenzyl esterase